MTFLEDRDLSDVPTIPEYYAGKTIFITGGSGFMGLALIEKLLYSCTDLDRIYVLLRTKRGVKSEERLKMLYASSCFERLKTEKPGVLEAKVFMVAGDVTELGLGLSEEDRMLLINRVNIIFHVAASVRFDDTLQYAAKLNLRGTRELLDLAKEVKNLSSLAHVSTSFSNCNEHHVWETMYPSHADWRDTLTVCDAIDEDTMTALTPKYLNGMPNTYVFTKQLAEHVVYEQRGKLPAVIIRPSVVVSSVHEPMPGWVNNYNGPNGLLIGGGKGIVRNVYSVADDLALDYIPIDVCIKHFVAAAWIRGTKRLEETDDVAIYNCTANGLLTFNMQELSSFGMKAMEEHPLENILWMTSTTVTSYKLYHYFLVYMFQILPAIFVDLVLRLLGRKPMLLRIQRKIFIAGIALEYFVTRSWIFDNSHFVSLRSRIKEQDREQFYYDLENIDKKEFYLKSALGGKKYLLNEKIEDLPKAKAHFYRMKVLDRVVKILFYAFVIWKILQSSYFQDFFTMIFDRFLSN